MHVAYFPRDCRVILLKPRATEIADMLQIFKQENYSHGESFSNISISIILQATKQA